MSTPSGEKTGVEVGLKAAGAAKVASALNGYLSDLHIAYGKLHNFHWNVEGTDFFVLHEKLQSLYEAIAEEIDDVAERVLKIGYRPLARLADYLEHTRLKETESRAYSGPELVGGLLKDNQALIERLRELIETAQEAGDEGTADDAIAWLKDKEKAVWMLAAYLG